MDPTDPDPEHWFFTYIQYKEAKILRYVKLTNEEMADMFLLSVKYSNPAISRTPVQSKSFRFQHKENLLIVKEIFKLQKHVRVYLLSSRVQKKQIQNFIFQVSFLL